MQFVIAMYQHTPDGKRRYVTDIGRPFANREEADRTKEQLMQRNPRNLEFCVHNIIDVVPITNEVELPKVQEDVHD